MHGVASATEAGFIVVLTGRNSGLRIRELPLAEGMDGGRGAGHALGVLGLGMGSLFLGATTSVMAIPLSLDNMLWLVTSWSYSPSSSSETSSS